MRCFFCTRVPQLVAPVVQAQSAEGTDLADLGVSPKSATSCSQWRTRPQLREPRLMPLASPHTAPPAGVGADKGGEVEVAVEVAAVT